MSRGTSRGAHDAAREYVNDWVKSQTVGFANNVTRLMNMGYYSGYLEGAKAQQELDAEVMEKLATALKRVSDHVQYLRHAEKRYREVGKEKYAFAKLNGPLSAIEDELEALTAYHAAKEKLK